MEHDNHSTHAHLPTPPLAWTTPVERFQGIVRGLVALTSSEQQVPMTAVAMWLQESTHLDMTGLHINTTNRNESMLRA